PAGGTGEELRPADAERRGLPRCFLVGVVWERDRGLHFFSITRYYRGWIAKVPPEDRTHLHVRARSQGISRGRESVGYPPCPPTICRRGVRFPGTLARSARRRDRGG